MASGGSPNSKLEAKTMRAWHWWIGGLLGAVLLLVLPALGARAEEVWGPFRGAR